MEQSGLCHVYANPPQPPNEPNRFTNHTSQLLLMTAGRRRICRPHYMSLFAVVFFGGLYADVCIERNRYRLAIKAKRAILSVVVLNEKSNYFSSSSSSELSLCERSKSIFSILCFVISISEALVSLFFVYASKNSLFSFSNSFHTAIIQII